MSATTTIDDEWENFISVCGKDDDGSSDDEYDCRMDDTTENKSADYSSANVSMDMDSLAPKSTNIYISTKTKIAYLNTPIDLKNIYWKVPVIPYSTPTNGVIKKQMKFNSIEREELTLIQNKLIGEPCYEENVITHIDNPDGRIKFKDIRKISIGISKKDILSYRCKKKSAFYNCFVLILRLKIADKFKEFHVKVFNTGKLEIPGVQNEQCFLMILDEVINIIQPHMPDDVLGYKPDSTETVLINSNFNCGFFINRESLFDILKLNYNIQCIYDPCSYPGIQCKFYYNPELEIQNGCQLSASASLEKRGKNCYEVSFMIFRTGSVLIVGKCDENAIMLIYNFLKIILNNEFKNISQKMPLENADKDLTANKKTKHRRKMIIIETTI